MTSTEETSFQLSHAIRKGIEDALNGFHVDATHADARFAIGAALAKMIETETRNVVARHLQVTNLDGKVSISLGAPLAHLLSDLLGKGDNAASQQWEFQVDLPGWTPPERHPYELAMTRQYIDPRTKRPTRGKPLI
jgi:hypothetical protein